MNIYSVSRFFSAHSSWWCTAPGIAQYYCHKFGVGMDTCHHVWGNADVWQGEVTWRSIKANKAHCTGVW